MPTIYDNNLDELVPFAGTVDVYPVITRIPGDLVTPLGAYCSIAGGSERSFLLESVEGGEHLARYSFIGSDPDNWVRETGSGLAAGWQDTETAGRGPILEYLRSHLGKHRFPPMEGLPGFLGGAVGFLDFDVSKQIEPTLAKNGNEKEGFAGSELAFFRRIVAFDHVKQTVNIISLVFGDESCAGADGLGSRLETAAEENDRIADLIQEGAGGSPHPAPADAGEAEFVSNFQRNHFESAVETVRELIAAGECYQVVLSQCFSRPTNASPVEIYRALRSLNPSPYMFLMNFGERAVIGASPEMLVRLRKGRLEYRPIAGTRPRSADPSEDDRLAAEMLADEKELAEHRMLVDLGRNDLGRVSQYGSVKVDDLMFVEKFSHVQHIVSSVSSQLREGMDGIDALEACFPAGTVSGAPKVRAMEIIDELEPTARGVYSGAVGYFDYKGDLDTCIAIRTILLEGGVARIQAGAGIVADSVPSREYEETVHKAAAMMRAVEIAETGRFAVRGARYKTEDPE